MVPFTSSMAKVTMMLFPAVTLAPGFVLIVGATERVRIPADPLVARQPGAALRRLVAQITLRSAAARQQQRAED